MSGRVAIAIALLAGAGSAAQDIRSAAGAARRALRELDGKITSLGHRGAGADTLRDLRAVLSKARTHVSTMDTLQRQDASLAGDAGSLESRMQMQQIERDAALLRQQQEQERQRGVAEELARQLSAVRAARDRHNANPPGPHAGNSALAAYNARAGRGNRRIASLEKKRRSTQQEFERALREIRDNVRKHAAALARSRRRSREITQQRVRLRARLVSAQHAFEEAALELQAAIAKAARTGVLRRAAPRPAPTPAAGTPERPTANPLRRQPEAPRERPRPATRRTPIRPRDRLRLPSTSGSEPVAPGAAAPVTVHPSSISRAASELLSNGRGGRGYAPRDGATFCNWYAAELAATAFGYRGFHDPKTGNPLLANRIITKMTSDPEWVPVHDARARARGREEKKIAFAESLRSGLRGLRPRTQEVPRTFEEKLFYAQGLANAGYLVVAGWRHYDKSRPKGLGGHVAVLVPGQMSRPDAESGTWRHRVPYVANAGSSGASAKTKLSWGFGPEKATDPQFVIYVRKARNGR